MEVVTSQQSTVGDSNRVKVNVKHLFERHAPKNYKDSGLMEMRQQMEKKAELRTLSPSDIDEFKKKCQLIRKRENSRKSREKRKREQESLETKIDTLISDNKQLHQRVSLLESLLLEVTRGDHANGNGTCQNPCVVNHCPDLCARGDDHQYHLCQEGVSGILSNNDTRRTSASAETTVADLTTTNMESSNGCPVPCFVPNCFRSCSDAEHLHELLALSPFDHTCLDHVNIDQTSMCGQQCPIEGCESTCVVPGGLSHDKHFCANAKPCNEPCKAPDCKRHCGEIAHQHCGETAHQHARNQMEHHFCPVHFTKEMQQFLDSQ